MTRRLLLATALLDAGERAKALALGKSLEAKVSLP
jgi:hypothetical protein